MAVRWEGNRPLTSSSSSSDSVRRPQHHVSRPRAVTAAARSAVMATAGWFFRSCRRTQHCHMYVCPPEYSHLPYCIPCPRYALALLSVSLLLLPLCVPRVVTCSDRSLLHRLRVFVSTPVCVRPPPTHSPSDNCSHDREKRAFFCVELAWDLSRRSSSKCCVDPWMNDLQQQLCCGFHF